LIAALNDFGFGSLGLTPSDFAEPDVVVQLGHAPKRIDLLTSIDGVTFDECWPDHVVLNIDGLEIPFIDVASVLQDACRTWPTPRRSRRAVRIKTSSRDGSGASVPSTFRTAAPDVPDVGSCL
jgi:hypothetical protein